MSSLKKCPFCGGEAKLYEQEFSGKTMYEFDCKNTSCTYMITQKTSLEDPVTALYTRYDDFESRTCGSCKYHKDCSIQDTASSIFRGSLDIADFGCNKWEPKQ